jgi:hypothetical protein
MSRREPREAPGREDPPPSHDQLWDLDEDIWDNVDVPLGLDIGIDVPLADVGKCKHCGCTETRACMVNGVPCHWYVRPDENGVGVCSNPECVKKETKKRR